MKNETTKFLLDTSVFIEADNHYYAVDICPGFWESLKRAHENSLLLSIDSVRGEITKNSRIENWIKEVPSLFVSSREQEVAEKYSEIIEWVKSNEQFYPEAKDDFAEGADGWLIAYAKVHALCLVTQEVFAENIKRRVPIPNVCKQFDVQYTDTFSILRKMRISFVLKPSTNDNRHIRTRT